jgi:hypothetical protein
MSVEIQLRLHKLTAQSAPLVESKVFILGRKDKMRLEAQRMKFLRSVTEYDINNYMRSETITE